MNDIAATRRDLQCWAARQPEPVRKAADVVLAGLRNLPHNKSAIAPVMYRFLMRDVETLRITAINARVIMPQQSDETCDADLAHAFG